VLFTVDLEGRIRRLAVTGHDESVLEFAFDKEVINPKLDDKLFKLQMPAGAELVDTSKESGN
jgi:outer membrane lipoprotein-sorting protein